MKVNELDWNGEVGSISFQHLFFGVSDFESRKVEVDQSKSQKVEVGQSKIRKFEKSELEEKKGGFQLSTSKFKNSKSKQ